MTKLLLTVEEQLTTLDECESFLQIFMEFCYDESVDTDGERACVAMNFLRRLPIYLPLITAAWDKIREVNKILDDVVKDGFEVVRNDG